MIIVGIRLIFHISIKKHSLITVFNYIRKPAISLSFPFTFSSLQLKVTKPNEEPHSPDTLRKIKINIKTKYTWNDDKGTEETVTPSSDGTIIVSRDVPSSADYVNLKVSILGVITKLSGHLITNRRNTVVCLYESRWSLDLFVQ